MTADSQVSAIGVASAQVPLRPSSASLAIQRSRVSASRPSTIPISVSWIGPMPTKSRIGVAFDDEDAFSHGLARSADAPTFGPRRGPGDCPR
jgi:hypothetical protein